MKGINHLAGAYDKEEQVQRCLCCGEILVDNRGAAVMVNPDGPTLELCGFGPGPVFRMGSVTGKGELEEGTPCYED